MQTPQPNLSRIESMVVSLQHDEDLTPSDHLVILKQIQRRTADALLVAVSAARQGGATWQEIGRDLGMTRQAAHETFAARVPRAPRLPWDPSSRPSVS